MKRPWASSVDVYRRRPSATVLYTRSSFLRLVASRIGPHFLILMLLLTGDRAGATSFPSEAQHSRPRPSAAEIRQAEAVLRSTPFGQAGAHFYDVRQVKLLELPTRSKPLLGFCARASTNPISLGVKFLAWRAQTNSRTHVILRDTGKHQAIYDNYCSAQSGRTIFVGDAADQSLHRANSTWSFEVWVVLTFMLAGGIMSGLLLSRPANRTSFRRNRTHANDHQRAIHLRAEDFF